MKLKLALSAMIMFFNLNTYALHPDVRRVSIDDRAYTCRPIDAQVACPEFPSHLSVRHGLDTWACLGEIAKQRPVIHQDELNCFRDSPTLFKYSDGFLLLDPSDECIINQIKWCKFSLFVNAPDYNITSEETLKSCMLFFKYTEQKH